MDVEAAEAFRSLTTRLEDAELRCKIVAYALRGAVSQVNPNSQMTARRMANTAVLAYCPEEQRARRIAILLELFPDARDRSDDDDFIPSPMSE